MILFLKKKDYSYYQTFCYVCHPAFSYKSTKQYHVALVASYTSDFILLDTVLIFNDVLLMFYFKKLIFSVKRKKNNGIKLVGSQLHIPAPVAREPPGQGFKQLPAQPGFCLNIAQQFFCKPLRMTPGIPYKV